MDLERRASREKERIDMFAITNGISIRFCTEVLWKG